VHNITIPVFDYKLAKGIINTCPELKITTCNFSVQTD
jgi:hypothetical protein